MPEDVRIVKMGASSKETPPAKETPRKTRSHPRQPKHGILKGGKTARKTPRFEGVRDPAKSPPTKSSVATLRILTDKGLSKRRKTIKNVVDKTPVASLRTTLKRSGLPISDKTPEHLVREIAAGGMEAGMIPL